VRFVDVFLAAYWIVLIAELIGDKSIYTIASLAVRIRPKLVFLSLAVAFGGKMLVAVLLGKALVQMPAPWTTVLSAVVFFSAAIFIWFKKPERVLSQPFRTTTGLRATAIAFASLFFTEWGDPGQISAAALTVQSQLPFATWLGGTLALMTKGAFAMTVGVKLRNWMPEKMLRTLASASCCVLGVLAVRDAILLLSG
jgi:putative Ca2+/H+ antiporter (TMEM165/GDT1 family)